ncbi:uncharacterized protein LOC123543993 [Mercenaria mercenaria]|uniref:uncharacterized protein LOC123543993 n=1 Tax=Mercenaria mercenaria TaxID=6596 RepID=UPI00234FAF13|nr:uncharacterized protein LOC123543993 [Mercenaria mercenaria]
MLNKLQEEAVNLAITGHNLFINGPAGTGKTYTIKEVYHRLTALGTSVAITCTTGIACTNFDNACTLHRWSGINDGRYSSSEIVNILLSNEGALHRIRSTDVLIIDEVSMLSKKLFEQLVSIVTQLRDVSKFLGGLQLIVSGDFFQLSPVPNKMYNDNGEYCFFSPTFMKLHKLTLVEVVRQTDSVIISAIQKVSVGGNIDKKTIDYIKSLERPLKNSQDSTKLYSTNDLVNSYNRSRIEQQSGTLKEYLSVDTGESKYLHEMTAPKKLWLKENCPVVLIRNLSDKLFNGLQGYVTSFSAEGPQVYFPTLKSTSTIGKVTFSVFSPTQNRVLAKREQVPLLLAYALTVHKAQGMTLDRVEVDCQQMFRPGQLGVAMGRVRSSDGLRVINFTPKVCIPQPDEIKGYLTMPYVEPADDFNCCTNISGV